MILKKKGLLSIMIQSGTNATVPYDELAFRIAMTNYEGIFN